MSRQTNKHSSHSEYLRALERLVDNGLGSPKIAEAREALEIVRQALDAKLVVCAYLVEEGWAFFGDELPGSPEERQRLCSETAARLAETPDPIELSAPAIGECVALWLQQPIMILFVTGLDTPISQLAKNFLIAASPGVKLPLFQVHEAPLVHKWMLEAFNLPNAARSVLTSENMEQALTDLASALGGAFEYSIAAIDVWDPVEQRMELRAVTEPPFAEMARIARNWKKCPVYESEAGLRAVMESNTPRVFPPGYRCAFHSCGDPGCGSVVVMPLVHLGDPMGTLSLLDMKGGGFSDEMKLLMQWAATLVAGTLRGLRLYRELASSREKVRDYAEKLQETMQAQHHLARADGLTGIPNRRYMEEVIEGERARVTRSGGTLSVIMVDIDRFKDINDSYGHKIGDVTLKLVAHLARRSCRKMDVVGRYGGDEYLFLLPQTSLEQAVPLAERFRRFIENEVLKPRPNLGFSITVSAGVAELLSVDETPESLLERADRALYVAKASGRNLVRAADESALAWVS